jgi:hypothetical protein
MSGATLCFLINGKSNVRIAPETLGVNINNTFAIKQRFYSHEFGQARETCPLALEY